MGKLHYVTITGIIIKEGKYLIAKRSSKEKVFPDKWTVPGGKVDSTDYEKNQKDTEDAWYNFLEHVLAREIMEETGLEVENFGYVTSFAFHYPDNVPAIGISLYCDWKSGTVSLSDELSEYAWVTAEQAEEYDLIEGILEEIRMVDKKLRGEKVGLWRK